jgi:hypothetical protein
LRQNSGPFQSFLRAIRSLRRDPSSQSVPSPRSKIQTATTVSFEWAQKCRRTSSAEQETSSAGDCERRPSTAEEVRAEEELQSEKISHHI